jgi:hypothetical protein
VTIEIAVRTGTAVVFAADSKVTTSAPEAIDQDGNPVWLEQTYDNATKVVQDRSGVVMAMAAGHVNVGRLAATDVIARKNLLHVAASDDQDAAIRALAEEISALKTGHWSTTEIPPERWPGPILLLAAASPDGETPRVWRIKLDGPGFEVEEILKEPGIRLEGSYDEIFALLYGFDWSVMKGILSTLGLQEAQFVEALKAVRVLRPIDKINFWAMPTQEAMDLAVFLAVAQCEMDRFLPGTPACGQPIDVMVLQTTPHAAIHAYPGKVLHHPAKRE